MLRLRNRPDFSAPALRPRPAARIAGRVALFALPLLAMTAPPAHASDAFGGARVPATDRAPVTVDELFRQNADVLRLSGAVGSFLLLTTVHAEVTYDDNVFASNKNQQEDFFLRIHPEARLVSQWSRHFLEFIVGGEGYFYQDFTDENRANFYTGFTSVIDVRHDLHLLTQAKYKLAHEPRGTGESFSFFEEPIRYQTYDGAFSVNKEFNRFWIQAGGTVRRDDYEDATLRTPAGKVNVDQDFRDGVLSQAIVKAGYEVSPKTSFFVEAAHEWRDYRSDDFDSHGYRLLGGVKYEFTSLVRGEAAAGVMHHEYDENDRDNVDTYTYRVQLLWDPTPLIKVAAVGSRDLSTPSAFLGGSTRVLSEIGTRVDYAIRRDIILTAAAGYQWVDYVDINRSDELLKLKAGAEYRLNPKWSFTLDYTHTDYDADAVPDVDYNRNLVTAGVKARF